MCPHGTQGPQCKVLSRRFYGRGGNRADRERRDGRGGRGTRDKKETEGGGSWAWVEAVPSCTEVHISLEVLTVFVKMKLNVAAKLLGVIENPRL